MYFSRDYNLLPSPHFKSCQCRRFLRRFSSASLRDCEQNIRSSVCSISRCCRVWAGGVVEQIVEKGVAVRSGGDGGCTPKHPRLRGAVARRVPIGNVPSDPRAAGCPPRWEIFSRRGRHLLPSCQRYLTRTNCSDHPRCTSSLSPSP